MTTSIDDGATYDTLLLRMPFSDPELGVFRTVLNTHTHTQTQHTPNQRKHTTHTVSIAVEQ